jgi:iron complex outermembrane recepter protein
MKKIVRKTLPAAIAAASVMSFPSFSFADGFLEEIVVTARMRDESLQKVPESVTVLTGVVIEDNGIDSLQGLADIAPNIHLNDSFSKATIRLNVRGIGTPQAGEAPVTFVVDGATVPDINFINQGIFDVESIQLLRGPQGALYGQGALAGAIIIKSKQPTNEMSGKIEGQFAKGNDKTINAAVSGPIIEDKLLFRLGLNYNDKEGLMENVEGEDVDFVDGAYNIRGSLTYFVNEDLEMKFIAKRSDGEYGYGVQYRVGDGLNDESTYRFANSNYPGLEIQESDEYTFQMDWELGFASLTAVTNYSELSDIIWLEDDATPVVGTIQIASNETDGFSQEIRLASPDDQRLRWMVGGAYRDRTNNYLLGAGSSPNSILDDGVDGRPSLNALLAQDQAYLNQQMVMGNDLLTAVQNGVTNGVLSVRDNAVTGSQDFGVFAFFSYDLTDALELTAALRYDEADREQDYIYTTSGGSVGSRNATFSETQPKLGLAYQVNEDILTYANYSRGFRAGGLNNPGYTLSPGEYDEEISDSYELGAKTIWYDGRLIVNTALFLLDVEGYQFSEFASTIGNANIHEADIKGFEIEMQARPTENITLNMAYGFTDAELVQFTEDPLDRPELDNKKIPFVPPYTFNVSVAHNYVINDDMSLRSYLAFRRNGSTYHLANNVGRIDTQEYWDGKVTLNVGEHWKVAAFVHNIKDYRAPIHFFLSSNQKATPNQPRSYGLSVAYDF